MLAFHFFTLSYPTPLAPDCVCMWGAGRYCLCMSGEKGKVVGSMGGGLCVRVCVVTVQRCFQ